MRRVTRASKMLFLGKRIVLFWVLHLLILCILIVITWIYVSSESGIYWWDYANYQNIAHGTLIAFRQSPQAALRFIQESLANNYNAVFTIPLLPFLLAFGESRLTFEVAIVVSYLFPFVLIMGHIARRVFPESPRFAYWSAIILALLTPSAWVPALRGYPDIGASFFCALSVFFSIGTPSKRMQLMAFAGAGLAIAALLRRHFIYDVLSFFVSWLLLLWWCFAVELPRNIKRAITEFLKGVLGLGIAGSTLLFMLFFIGRPFLKLLVTQNFNILYASYEQPWYVVLSRFAFSFGWIFGVLGVAGCMMGIISRNFGSQLVCVFGIISASVWVFLGRQLGNHYSLHFILLVIQGMVVLLQSMRNLRPATWRYIIYTINGLLLLINFILGITPIGAFDAPWRKLFAQNWSPIQRHDVEQIRYLVEDLRALTDDQPDSVIYVVASSSVLNSDLIANLERTVYGWEASRLNLISCEVDSKHPYPLEALLRARIVVLAQPLQLHLNPEEQGLVRSVFELFTNRLYLARDFALLPNHYVLDGGVTAHLFKRVRPTSPDDAIQTLGFIRKYIMRFPATQPPWIVLNPPYGVSIYASSPYQYRVTLPARNENSFPSALLFLGQQAQIFSVSGLINYPSQDCLKITLDVFKVYENGEKHLVCTLPLNSSDDRGEFACSLGKFTGDSIAFYIYIQEANEQKINTCSLEMEVQMTLQSYE